MSRLNTDNDQHVNEERATTTTTTTATTTAFTTSTATCPTPMQRPRSPSLSPSSSSSSSGSCCCCCCGISDTASSSSSSTAAAATCHSSANLEHMPDSVASEMEVVEEEEIQVYPTHNSGSGRNGLGGYNVRTRFRENAKVYKPTRLQSLIKWHRRVVMAGTLTLYTLILLECIQHDLGNFCAMVLLIGIAIRVNLWPPDFHAMFLRIRESLRLSSLAAATANHPPDLTNTSTRGSSTDNVDNVSSSSSSSNSRSSGGSSRGSGSSSAYASAGISATQRQAFNNDAMILSNLILFVMRQAICPTRPYLYSLSLALNAFNTVMRHPTLNTPVLVIMVILPSVIVAWDAYRDMDLLASIAALQVLSFVGFMLIGGTLSLMTALKRASSVSRRLEDALRAKSKLIAWTSHELRSPIFAIQGSLELLRKTRELSPEQLEHLRAIECSNTMVMTLVEDVLAYAKAEHEAHSSMRQDESLIDVLELYDSMNWRRSEGLRMFLDGNGDDDDDDDIDACDADHGSGIMSHGPENLVNLAWFSLADCIDTVMSIGRGYSRSMNVRLELHYSPSISIFSRQIMAKGDSVKIQQCLVNLISNAIKFSPEHSSVILEIDLVDTVAINIDRVEEDRNKYYRANESGRRFNDSSGSSGDDGSDSPEIRTNNNNNSHSNNNSSGSGSNEAYSGQRGHMDLSLDTIGGKRTLEFRVVDYGSGITIDRDKRDMIFLPFAQLNIQQSKIPSSGLGLGICKQLVKAMHGSIDFYSETEGKNRGTTFVLRLPVSLKTITMSSENDPTSSSSIHSEELSISHSRSSSDDLFDTNNGEVDREDLPEIILAEDNPVVRRVMMRLLNDCGIRAAAVSNGQLLMDALDSRYTSSLEQFRVVVLDKNMPILNGIQCARLVRQRYPGVYIVMVTGDTVSEEERALMDHVLSKPVTGTQICTTIRELIQ